MPELPEVETIVQALRPVCLNQEIMRARIADAHLSAPLSPRTMSRHLQGRIICAVERRAKFIVFALDDDALLVVHLRMTGQFRLDATDAPLRHERARWELSPGATRVAYVDQRRFGRWQLHNAASWAAYEATHLGPEPLAGSASRLAAHLHARARGRGRAIKPFLMDPAMVVGVGNIYAMEALYAAGIAPTRPAGSLTEHEWHALARTVRQALRAGIRRGGSTVGEYRRPDGSAGRMQHVLAVYGRAGQECRQCGTPLQSAVLGGRSSVWCGQCQC